MIALNYPLEILRAFVLTAAVLLSARLWGEAILRWMRWTGEGRGERCLAAIAIGLGAISYGIFALACLGLLYPVAVWILLALSLPAALAGGIFRCPAAALPAGDRKAIPLPRSAVLPLSVVALLFAYNLFSALAPPYAGDALGYHLPAVRAYLAAHRLIWLPGNVLANQPAAVDMLFAVGFAGKSELFPQILHCVFGLLTAVAVFIFGRRRFGASAAALGSLIFYSVPAVSAISGWAYIDLGLALWTVLAVLSYLRWREEERTGAEDSRRFAKIRGLPFGMLPNLVLAAVFSGLAMGSKYTGLIAIGALWSLAALEAIRRGRGAGNAVLGAAILALAVGSPWYLKNALLSGNPVYPFAYSLFGGRDWDAARARDYRQILLGYGMGKLPIDYLLLPWNLSVRAEVTYDRFDGILGPAFLLLSLGVFAGRKNPSFRVLSWFCLAFFTVWSFLSQQVRMLMPILPLAGLLVGAIVVALWERPAFALRQKLRAMAGKLSCRDPGRPGSGQECPSHNELSRTCSQSLWERHSCRDPAKPMDRGKNAPPTLNAQSSSLRSMGARSSIVIRASLVLGLAAILAMNGAAIVREAARTAPWRIILGEESREEYLSRLVYNFPAVEVINRRLPPKSRVLFVYGGNAWYYARPETVVDSIFQDATILRLVRQSVSGADLAARLKAAGITHLLLNARFFAEGTLPVLTDSEKDTVREFMDQRADVLYREGDNYVMRIIGD